MHFNSQLVPTYGLLPTMVVLIDVTYTERRCSLQLVALFELLATAFGRLL